MGLLTQLNTLVLLGYGGYLVIRGELLLGRRALRVQQSAAGCQPGRADHQHHQHQNSRPSGGSEVLDARELASPPNAVRLPKARGRLLRTFIFLLARRTCLEGIVRRSAGQCVAIVGANCSGLVSLLS